MPDTVGFRNRTTLIFGGAPRVLFSVFVVFFYFVIFIISGFRGMFSQLGAANF